MQHHSPPSLSGSLRLSSSHLQSMDLPSQVSILRQELADTMCRNEDLERHLHLARNEVSFLRSEMELDAGTNRDSSQLVLFSGSSGKGGGVSSANRDSTSSGLDQECALLRKQLEEADLKLHQSIEESATLHAKLEESDRKLATSIEESSMLKEELKTRASLQPEPIIVVDKLKERLQYSTTGTQGHLSVSVGVSTQTDEIVVPVTTVAELEAVIGVDAFSSSPSSPSRPSRQIPVHDPSDPKHRAECLWCSGKTIKKSGGTFGVATPKVVQSRGPNHQGSSPSLSASVSSLPHAAARMGPSSSSTSFKAPTEERRKSLPSSSTSPPSSPPRFTSHTRVKPKASRSR